MVSGKKIGSEETEGLGTNHLQGLGDRSRGLITVPEEKYLAIPVSETGSVFLYLDTEQSVSIPRIPSSLGSGFL